MTIPEIKYKQFVIVPRNPKMSTGKVASQVAHATFMALDKQDDRNLQAEWIKNGMCVIVLECEDITQLIGINEYLNQWNVVHHMYIDEGLTEVGMGTATALATGILTEEYFWMFMKLKLYGTKKSVWRQL